MTTDLTPVLERLDALSRQVAYLAERQRAQEELIAEMTPIAREVLGAAVERLDALDKQGYFEFASELAGVVRKVVEGFSPDDVHRLGDSIVGILETVRSVREPEVLDVKPVGMLGFARATRKQDVRKGLAVMVEVLRRLGRRTDATAVPRELEQKARLAELLGPRRARPQLPAPAAARPAAAPRPAPPRAAVKATPPPVATTADADWTQAKAEALASDQGIALTEAHWAVINAARADFASTEVSPNIRRLTQITGVTTKDLYALFPKAPGRAIAAIAGLPKPAGCL